MIIIGRRADDERFYADEAQAIFGGKIHAWIPQNEPKVFYKLADGTPDMVRTTLEMGLQADFEIHSGSPLVGAFATGDPGGSWDQIKEFMLTFAPAMANARWYGRHGYQEIGKKMSDSSSWVYHIGRICAEQAMFYEAGLRFPNVIFTEIGQDRMGERTFERYGEVVTRQVGWWNRGEDQFCEDLRSVFLRLNELPYVHSACVFCAGTNGDRLWSWCDVMTSPKVLETLRQIQAATGKVGLHILEDNTDIRQAVIDIRPRTIVCTPAAADLAKWAYDTFPEADEPEPERRESMGEKEDLALGIQRHIQRIKDNLNDTGVLANEIIALIDDELAAILADAGKIHDLPNS